MEKIKVPRTLVNELLHLAQQSPHEEVCGLISADGTGLKQCYPVANIATDKKRFFELDPRAHIAAVRAMRSRGQALAAIYHSHPSAAALPSLADVHRHEHPELLYLIISLNTKGVLEIRGFRIEHERAHEVVLSI